MKTWKNVPENLSLVKISMLPIGYARINDNKNNYEANTLKIIKENRINLLLKNVSFKKFMKNLGINGMNELEKYLSECGLYELDNLYKNYINNKLEV